MNINENDVLIVKDNSKRIRKSNAIKLPPQINESMIQKIILPKYVSLKKHEKDKDKYYLIFDKKIGENRQTYKTLCNNKLSINQNLDEFIKKINEKYL